MNYLKILYIASLTTAAPLTCMGKAPAKLPTNELVDLVYETQEVNSANLINNQQLQGQSKNTYHWKWKNPPKGKNSHLSKTQK